MLDLPDWHVLIQFFLYIVSTFYTLEVVGRGSETQLQVCKKIDSHYLAFQG